MYSHYKFKIGEIAQTKDGFKVEIVDRTKDNSENYYTCKPIEFKSFYREISEKNLIKVTPIG